MGAGSGPETVGYRNQIPLLVRGSLDDRTGGQGVGVRWRLALDRRSPAPSSRGWGGGEGWGGGGGGGGGVRKVCREGRASNEDEARGVRLAIVDKGPPAPTHPTSSPLSSLLH